MDSDQTETVDPDEPVVDLAILAPGTLVASRYEIERLLGTGGFARVYAARDAELGQRIAIKILRSERITPATLARLRREVSIAREIPRETLVRVYDLGQDGEHTFLTMELVEGETLRDRIRRGTMDVEEIVRMAEPILDGLGALHAAGVVHRDLKPANILLTASGAVKLADFGLARRWDGGEKVTRTEALVGTLEYVAPEQALGKQLDGRADLYAFGVLLFEMLTGKLPLEAATNLGTVMAHIISAAPDVRTIRSDVPAWLSELIQRLMEKEPDARPQSAAAVLSVIRARKRDLGWRWRKSRLRFAAWAALAAALAAGTLWAWTAYWGAFDHVTSDVLRRLIAYDRRGRVLWTKDALILGNTAAVVKFDGKTPSIVGIPGACDGGLPLEENHRLTVFDPRTGEVTREFDIPSAASSFPLDPTFGPSAMTAVDPDHDGREDIVLSYVHSPYWPSYSVYIDPRTTESTPILLASGHHRLAGLADIDGDGVDELFFAGSNNKMGWFAGIAAVKLVRHDNKVDSSSPWIPTGTPDAEYARGSTKALLWYSLQPRMSQYGCRLLSSDPVKRLLRFEFGGETIVELTYDGFLPGSSTLPSEERRRGREDAYGMLREGLRTSLLGEHDGALRLIHEAHAKADAIADPSLAEWAATNEAIVMSRAGRAAEAEALFEELMKTSGAPLEICWQAGQAFEASGELDRAARFLRRGVLEGTRDVRSGRTPSAFFEPLMLVLAQQEKWDEAARDVARFNESIPEEYPHIHSLEIFVAWRSGGAIDTEGLVPVAGRQEVFNYWLFEARWANGVSDPAAFLREMNEFRKVKAAPVYLYESLESEILARLGRTDEAKALAKKALDDTMAAAKDEMIARAHVKVVQDRYARMR